MLSSGWDSELGNNSVHKVEKAPADVNDSIVTFSCKVCGKVLKSRKGLETHEKMHHVIQLDGNVSSCDFEDDSDDAKEEAEEESIEEESEKCEIENDSNLLEVSEKINEISYEDNSKALEQNDVTHRIIKKVYRTGPTRYKCASCGYIFMNKDECSNHILDKHGET